MLKYVLLSLILIACACVGRMLSNARKRRYEVIGEQLAAMRVLRLRMLNSMEPMGILLRKSDSKLFRNLGNSLWEGSSLQECWEKIRSEESKRGRMLDSLCEADLRLLDAFFTHLGKSGREEQCQLFASSIEQLEEVQQQAKRGFAEAAKMYTALGALVGIAICIMLV